MEVVAGGPGGEPLSETRARARLNLALIVTAVLCTALVAWGAWVTWDARSWEDIGSSGGGDLSGRAGTSVGRGTVTAVRSADEAEQQRVADQLEAATKMVNAFMNLRYDDIDAGMATVREWSTGQFLEQFNAGSEPLVELMKSEKSVQESDVVWSGLVSGDDDSARVILAVRGTVSNRASDFEKTARHWRIQVDLTLEEERWLVSDLQFVESMLGGATQ